MKDGTSIELGRSGLSISRVVFGAMALSERDVDRARTLRAAIDAGVSTIDTAPLYEFGRSEELVGRAIAGLRDRVQLLTKVGLRWDDPRGQVLFRFHDDSGREQAVRRNSRPDSVRFEVEQSLRRMRVEVLDLVQVHHPDPDTPIEDTMGALADLLREGKLRAIGVSNYSAAQMKQAQAALGTVALASNQVHYSLLERWPEVEILPLARAGAFGVLAYSPLEQGLLTGRLSPARFRGDGRSDDPRFHRDNLDRISAASDRALAPLAAERGVSVAQLALAWLLAQDGLSGVVVGASSPEQATQNAAAMQLSLSAQEQAQIREAFSAVKLDPNAGQGRLGRLAKRAERVVQRVRRVREKLLS